MTFSGGCGDHIEYGVMQSWGLKQSGLWKLTFGGSPTETESMTVFNFPQTATTTIELQICRPEISEVTTAPVIGCKQALLWPVR